MGCIKALKKESTMKLCEWVAAGYVQVDPDVLAEYGQCLASLSFRNCVHVTINSKSYLLHRLIHPEIPEIDHKDLNPANNLRSNLRAATRSENQHNTGIRKTNTSGYKGVNWDKGRRKWKAEIGIAGKLYKLGRFDDKKDAARAYNKEALKQFGEFARLNIIED